MPEMGVFEAAYSARAIRRFKPDPVPDELITKVLDMAIRAPSAGNEQRWLFVVVTDAAQRRKVGDIYRRASQLVRKYYETNWSPEHMTDVSKTHLLSSGEYLWEHMADAPVIVIPCLRLSPPRAGLPAEIANNPMLFARTSGASIYPACQNIILACRALGLGTVLTTNHIYYEQDLKTALGLEPEVFTYALMPIGYPIGKFGPVKRRPLSEVAVRDRWGTVWPKS